MRYQYLAFLMIMCSVMMCVSIAVAQHGQRMMHPRVPADKIEEARALKSPWPPSKEFVAEGKAIYEGKGNCVNCHGKTGRGDGPGAINLSPSPRVFRSHGFWRHRTEGEIFWVIKHGSPGTAMIPFGGLLTDREIWTVMQYEQSFAGGYGGDGRIGRHKDMRPHGRHGGNRQHGHHKQSRGSGKCCEKSE